MLFFVFLSYFRIFKYDRDLWLVVVVEDLCGLSVQGGLRDCVNSPFLLPDCVKMKKKYCVIA